MIGLSALANPWVLLGLGAALIGSHGYMYYQGRQDGGNKAALACEVRVAKLQGEYDAQAKHIENLNKQHQAALDAFVESEAKRAQDRQKELDEANAKADAYEDQLSDAKRACVLDQSDIDSVR
jgi:predicted  nucleic acid-binding Zn-ribbon protein